MCITITGNVWQGLHLELNQVSPSVGFASSTQVVNFSIVCKSNLITVEKMGNDRHKGNKECKESQLETS